MRRILLLLSLLVVCAGCFPAPPQALTAKSISLGDNTTAEICTTVVQLEAMKVQAYESGRLAGCKADIVLNNPTYAQLQQFLKDNQTLTMCEGNCVERTKNLAECAFNYGWEMYVVLLNAEEEYTGHVIGAFQTKDKGMVFIESQTLWEMKVELGYDYSLNWKAHNWSFPKFTIKQIGIIR